MKRFRDWVRGGEERDRAHAVAFAGGEEHPGVTGMHWEREHLPPEGAEVSRGAVERTQVLQEEYGTVQRAAFGRFEPAEGVDVVHAAGLECEDDFGEVETADLGRFLRGAVGVFPLGPQPQAMAGGGASGTARALVGGGTADFFDEQGVDAPVRVEPRDPGETRVDDEAHAIDSE